MLSPIALHKLTSHRVSDPLLSSTLSDLFRTLSSSSSPVMEQSLRQVALPRLAQLLEQEENDETRPLIDAGVVALNAILDGRPTPLGSGLFAPVASAVFGVLSRTEDDSVLQEGLECFTFVVRKDVDQLIQWYVLITASGHSGTPLTLTSL